ncbi:MAG: SRPBCC family protein [Caldimonas sp.]
MQRVTRSAVIDAPVDRLWAVLRDFNSHAFWHPAIEASEIEGRDAGTQVGCVRSFALRDGNRLREQLLSLDDHAHTLTYCVLDGTLPLRRYVATLQVKSVTDGGRSFWHWSSTFEAPPGREAELALLVGGAVYQAGFDGMRAWLQHRGLADASATVRGSARGQAVVLRAHGGADRLELVDIEVPPPGPGEVRLRQTAVGVNYIDVYIRNGAYAGMLALPGTPGMEAAGTVLDVGAGVTDFFPGDRVAYLSAVPGAYATARTLDAGCVVRLPDDIGDEAAASLMLKGITAQYLLHDLGRVGPGMRVLVHAAAGGVGLLVCQWARALGAVVIGCVSTEAKARVAREHGCTHVIVTGDYRFADAVLQATGGHGADLILDGLGDAAFEQNLRTLATRGHWVSYGQASGALRALAPEALSAKSATFSRPVVFHYTADPAELRQRAARVFDAVRAGILMPCVHHRYPLAAAAQAHAELEARRTTGALVLVI